MPKAIFTQAICVLLPATPTLERVQDILSPAYRTRVARPSGKTGDWIGGGEAIVIEIPNTRSGKVQIIVEPRPWPDGMGHPKTQVELFAAWSMGFLGPHTFPGNLARAIDFAENLDEHPLAAQARDHKAFLLLRATQAGGNNEPMFPPGYDPISELQFVTSIARTLLAAIEEAVFFCPGGERLHDPSSLAAALDQPEGVLPLPAWCNVRLYRLDELAPGWLMMDSVGSSQLLPPAPLQADQEACWNPDHVEISPAGVWNFLLNAAMYRIEHGTVIETGHTMDGAGIRWRATVCDTPINDPPRPTIRWFPANAPSPIPKRLLPKPRA